MNLKVLTYNVFGMPWGLKCIESVLLWAFYKTDAEILCLQELFSEAHKKKIKTICGKEDSFWTCWFPSCEATLLSSMFESFACPTGLCVLIKKHIQVTKPPVFQEFEAQASIDKLVRKGFLHLSCEKEGRPLELFTTHFQSDFTEVCCRISYQSTRIFQEMELFHYAKQFPSPVIVGDFNMSRFYHFRIVNSNREPTFPQTGESLDHCISLQPVSFSCQSATYYPTVTFSDHIPVLFSLFFHP